MHTMSLSARARTSARFAAAGIAALVTTLAVAGSADAATDPPRLTIDTTVDCATSGFRVFYDDNVDGHVPQTVHETLLEDGHVIWSADEVHQVNGDYFNERAFPEEGRTLSPTAVYLYSVTITYDDGVVQDRSSAVVIDATCSPAPSTTAPPTTSAPAPDRFGLLRGHHGCGQQGAGAFVEWTFLDVPDGHLPSGYNAELSAAGVPIESTGWTDLAGTDGDDRTFVAPTDFHNIGALTATSYTLSVTINYDDGVNETHIETFDLAQLCGRRVNGASPPGPAPSTTAPTGTLPETGSGDALWVLGAIAGLLTTAGAALFAAARRSRSD